MPTKVTFLDYDLPEGSHTYVVFCCRCDGQWLFVRHRDRQTWEIPGGHLEPGETTEEACMREIREETGATSFTISKICDYTVENEAGFASGRLFLADILERNTKLEHEIAEIMLLDQLPEQLTYPEIQPKLMQKMLGYLLSGQ